MDLSEDKKNNNEPQKINIEAEDLDKFFENIEGDEEDSPFIKSNPQADLFSMPDYVRIELNLAKFAEFIFVPPKSPYANKSRKKEFTVLTKSKKGDTVEIPASVEVLKTDGIRTPTTRSYTVLMAVLELYRQKGADIEGFLNFSNAEVCKILEITNAGSSSKMIREELDSLSLTNMIWERSFIGTDKERKKMVRHFKIFTDMQYTKATRDVNKKPVVEDDTFEPQHKLRLNPAILESYEAKHIKPIDYRGYKKLRGKDGALQLLAYLDNNLSRKLKWRKKLAPLSKALLANEYKHKSKRKEVYSAYVEQLNGISVYNGTIKLRIALSSDETDYVLHAERTPFEHKPVKKPVNDEATIQILQEDMMAVCGASKKDIGLYITLAQTYPRDMLFTAISLYKADGHRESAKTPALFTTLIHELAHSHNLDWIKECGIDCPLRPENKSQKPLF